MCFHTLRKDKGIQNLELLTFKPEINFRLLRRLRGVKLRRVLQRAQNRGSSDCKEYFKYHILCGKLVKVDFKKENARLHFGF